MAVTDFMIDFALTHRPAHCCFVPEKRQELTTEGGLDVCKNENAIQKACEMLQNSHIDVSLFIEPKLEQIEAALRCGAKTIELHTGKYAEIKDESAKKAELEKIHYAVNFAHRKGLIVNAGHGLNYENVNPIANIPAMNELNIGHSIVAKALTVGLFEAVKEMKELIS